MNIHSLFILRKGGIPVYRRNFDQIFESMDSILVSSFFTAILDFSREVLKDELNVIEIGQFRFFFKKEVNDIYFILITDLSTSILLIREWMKLISRSFFSVIDAETCSKLDCVIENSDLDFVVDSMIRLDVNRYNEDEKIFDLQAVNTIYNDEMQDGEILAGALLSMRGEIYYSSLPMEDLHSMLREIEIRSQTDTNLEPDVMPKLILKSGKKMTFSQAILSEKLQEPLVVSLLFDYSTNLGMADFALERITKKISILL